MVIVDDSKWDTTKIDNAISLQYVRQHYAVLRMASRVKAKP